MSLLDLLLSVRHAFADVRRAALTLLGIIIATSSLVLLLSLVHGGKEAMIRASQEAVDADLVTVRREEPPVKDRSRPSRELARSDAAALSATPGIEGAPLSQSVHATEARAGSRKKRVSLASATRATRALNRLSLAAGRFIDDVDLAGRRRVCVLGHEVWATLFGEGRDRPTRPLGEMTLRAAGHTWTVVGVLDVKPMLDATDDTNIWDRKVIVPETSYDALLSPSHRTDLIHARVERGAASTPLPVLRRILDATLLRRHLGVRNFRVEDQDTRGQEDVILSIVQLLLVGAAGIAMFVGGINIMNTMLVVVTERTREIGVRRAVGAPPRAILAQFLLEACALALVGGVLGVLVGVSLSHGAAALLRLVLGRWEAHVEPLGIVLGLGLSLITGVVFGFYPAWRAARLDPIDALRSE